MNLYFLMSALFIVMAVIAALDASLASWGVLPWFNGLRWVRVHLVTLGVMTEALFGALPLLVAIRFGLPRPASRRDIWIALNAGILTLLIGIPIVNQALILTGGTLVFAATVLLVLQIQQMRPARASTDATDLPATLPATQPTALPTDLTTVPQEHAGRRFYLAGLGFFLLGIVIGTGLWLGWSGPLRIVAPLESHIHANNWGLMSLVFAGLIVDTYPRWAARPLAWPGSVAPIFWLMTFGALGLVFGPWFQTLYLTVPGLVLHLTATVWLLLNVIRPLWGDRAAWSTPGIWHLVTSYFWILAPVMMAPLVILKVPGFPAADIEANAPQALIYGWVFQFGFAMLPYVFRRAFLPDEPPRLGGHWFSLATATLGGICLWASIFILPQRGLLHGMAYALWAAATVPIAVDLWRIVGRGLARLDVGEDLGAGSHTTG
jgi:cytochrome c oxidase cbb3-type subunit 1